MNMRYCMNCILPDTRPGLRIEPDGICNACHAAFEKQKVDWVAREAAFREVVNYARTRSGGYDCIVPVSGGKDSTWQVVKCLEYGLRPLAVSWKPPARTQLGWQNLNNLINLGVDHIDYQINPEVERRFVYESFLRYGSTAIPMHMAIFSIPLNIAVRFGIPLVIWGENSAFEYGTSDDVLKGFELNTAWLRQHGVTHGTTARDWVSEQLSERDLAAYFAPDDAIIEAAGVRAIFLGYYFKWDPLESLRVSCAHGFMARADGPRVGFWNYADLDDDFISVHHWLKWYKFGFTRLFDNLSVEIRCGRLTRDEAIAIVKLRGNETPHEDICKLCDYLSIDSTHFFEVAERFRNLNIWTRRNDRWVIPEYLIPDWNWS